MSATSAAAERVDRRPVGLVERRLEYEGNVELARDAHEFRGNRHQCLLILNDIHAADEDEGFAIPEANSVFESYEV